MEEQPIEKEQFEDFLKRKNINAQTLFACEPAIYQKWENLFNAIHEESFVMQQKFYINPMRRKYPLISHQNN